MSTSPGLVHLGLHLGPIKSPYCKPNFKLPNTDRALPSVPRPVPCGGGVLPCAGSGGKGVDSQVTLSKQHHNLLRAKGKGKILNHIHTTHMCGHSFKKHFLKMCGQVYPVPISKIPLCHIFIVGFSAIASLPPPWELHATQIWTAHVLFKNSWKANPCWCSQTGDTAFAAIRLWWLCLICPSHSTDRRPQFREVTGPCRGHTVSPCRCPLHDDMSFCVLLSHIQEAKCYLLPRKTTMVEFLPVPLLIPSHHLGTTWVHFSDYRRLVYSIDQPPNPIRQ